MRHIAIGWIFVFWLLMVIVSPLVLAEQPQRGVTVAPATADSVPITGEYWALIIGIDQYRYAPKLESAVRDANGIRDVLMARYGFKPEHIVELYDAQATGSKIQNALYRLGRDVGKDDSVLIYYAGHGQYEEEGKLGWWVPVEGEPKEPGTFITNASIRDYINGMKARHVYLVADSCFSGTLFGTRALPPINDQWFSRLYQKPSRWGLTSGGKEPVTDRGKDGHSVFAYHLIALLQENTDPYLVPSQLHTMLAPLVANNAEQTPQSEPLRGAGDEGGQFVFRLAAAAGGPLPLPLNSGGSSDEMTRMRAELEMLKAQGHKPVESFKPVEVAKAPAYVTRPDKPRIMVIVAERHVGAVVTDTSGEAEIIRLLLQKGFKVVDQAQVRKIREGDQLKQLLEGDIKAAQSLGRQHGAEVLIVGEAFSEIALQGMMMGGIVSVRGRLQAKAILADTGEILAAEEANAPALDVSEQVAGKKAISTAANRWMDAALPVILEQWTKESGGGSRAN
ncbi:MAG: caspase domain-containing protein [Nitrospirales bacterium]